jgi:hypothetical protein
VSQIGGFAYIRPSFGCAQLPEEAPLFASGFGFALLRSALVGLAPTQTQVAERQSLAQPPVGIATATGATHQTIAKKDNRKILTNHGS